jgi:hypothetical protein
LPCVCHCTTHSNAPSCFNQCLESDSNRAACGRGCKRDLWLHVLPELSWCDVVPSCAEHSATCSPHAPEQLDQNFLDVWPRLQPELAGATLPKSMSTSTTSVQGFFQSLDGVALASSL